MSKYRQMRHDDFVYDNNIKPVNVVIACNK